ncbi:MAG: MBL fold metallo-hydrolase [Nannocystaceae bacterium]
MIFRQLIDRETSTYTYLLGDPESGEAVIIDPVRDQIERDVELLQELGLELRYVLDTHVHADHITASGLLRARLNAKTVVSKAGGAPCADVLVEDGNQIAVGSLSVEVRATPGHTNGCITYVVRDGDRTLAFTGDALLIRGCGRCDFQQGDARALYNSVHTKIFSLPPDTLIYPGHDYRGRTVTTVAEERAHNRRLGGGKSEAEFLDIMGNLQLQYPAKIDQALPANLHCGMLPSDRVSDSPTRETTVQTVNGEPLPEKAWAPLVRTTSGVPEVSPAWVAGHRKEVLLLDVRSSEELQGPLGRLPEVVHIPLGELATRAESFDRQQAIVTICRSGGRSGDAARTLEKLGFCRVASMAGGMEQWLSTSS